MLFSNTVWEYGTGWSENTEQKETASVIDQQIKCREICNVTHPTETEMWITLKKWCKSWDGQSANYVDKIAANKVIKEWS